MTVLFNCDTAGDGGEIIDTTAKGGVNGAGGGCS